MKADNIKNIISDIDHLPYRAILFDGTWGIGKSYAVNEALEANPNVCKISMFGLKDTRQIYHEALFQLALKNNILAVSNPAFELFLLLHYENSYEDDIEPNVEQIIQNEKDGHQTFIYKLLLARTGINPKKNSAIGELAKNIEIAIEQEKKINEDIHQCKGQITCNIGRIIDDIRNDDGK